VLDRTGEDIGNIIHFEHVNLKQPDQHLATLFYVSGLGLTRDPYMMVGLDNMWINVGRNQIHLPTGNPQQLRGTIGLVIRDLNALRERLQEVAPLLAGTQFAFREMSNCIEATCPWGNRYRCHTPSPEFGRMQLGIPYVEFTAPEGTAARIARFYREIFNAPVETSTDNGSLIASVGAGRDHYLRFRETSARIAPYDGHHVQIYIANFSGPYGRLLERHLITLDTDQHEWRFRDIVDLDTNEALFTIEHEVRSLKHPLYARPLVNRNPAQNNRNYISSIDAPDNVT
jgi:hypothetical protein